MSKPFYERGAYVAEVTAQALGKANTGTPQLVLRFRVLGKPDPKDANNYIPVQEYERTIYRTITENTIDFVMEDLEQLGYSRTGFGPFDPSHHDHQSFVGKQIDVYCKHEANQKSGDQQERWQLSRGAPALKVDSLDAKEIRGLDMLFGKNLKGASKSSPETSTQRTAASARSLEVTDDDIPF